MTVKVYGLGIIGASVCASLKNAGYTVYAKNRSKQPVAYALKHGYIDGETDDFEGADAVVLALPPRVCMELLDCAKFPDGCVVLDICGVKEALERVVLSKKRNYRYVGIHPMAGKETTGVASASPTLFRGANLVVTKNESTDESAYQIALQMGRDMGFGRIVTCSAAEHDKMIALTSQLAHVVSNGYIKSPQVSGCTGFTGGSFQDMTRVAPLDEYVWTELFFLNRENLLGELTRLIEHLTEYKAALEGGDGDLMRKLLLEGKECFASFQKV